MRCDKKCYLYNNRFNDCKMSNVGSKKCRYKIQRDSLSTLIKEIKNEINRNDLSDNYFESWIGEFQYGVTSVPAFMIIEHLKRLEKFEQLEGAYNELEDWAIDNHSHNEHVDDILNEIEKIRRK